MAYSLFGHSLNIIIINDYGQDIPFYLVYLYHSFIYTNIQMFSVVLVNLMHFGVVISLHCFVRCQLLSTSAHI